MIITTNSKTSKLILTSEKDIHPVVETEVNVRKSIRARKFRLRLMLNGEIELTVPSKHGYGTLKNLIDHHSEWLISAVTRIINNPFKEHLFFGKKVELSIITLKTKYIHFELKESLLKITVQEGHDLSDIKLVDLSHKAIARKYLTHRIKILSEKTGLSPKKIRIAGQKSRWGSCSGKGTLSLNYKLIIFHPRIIDYVLIHELCHLQEMNHSRAFWQLVEKFDPQYKLHRKLLKELKVNDKSLS
ncbi:MAG: M48 family metallopeptidase [Ignavibacteriales bacterium]|nr:M48 family metallopeptidase [Ignavibacteriales bacterium]MCF8435791.1 M48 family metallopeptidase [Ignavibacteriales bacterium]